MLLTERGMEKNVCFVYDMGQKTLAPMGLDLLETSR